ncbi:MAG: acyltransferase [Candidatus Riflebacteria bacterium]|nr:acyltransferase [Candidatus Riflebacteria bacterium]
METAELEAVVARYRSFLAGSAPVFVHRFRQGRREVDFCICSGSVHGPLELAWLNLRYGILQFVLALPWSWPKVQAFRLFGARIGKRVYISQRVYIDPMYPELLTIGDDVLIGLDAKIFFHEITQTAYRVGRVRLQTGCLVGAGSMLRPGITIGEGAEVGALSAVASSVPPHTTVFGVPARPLNRSSDQPADDEES